VDLKQQLPPCSRQGASASIGAGRLHNLIAQLYVSSKNRDLDHIRESLPGMHMEYQLFRTEAGVIGAR
jgi:hypothetical protein